MLKYVACKNFRKHEDLRVEFTAGINAIRAANEAGKSTLLESIAYAFFGAAGLKEPIEDVVTYGVPSSKLSVEMGFELAHVDYIITRSPKGAELSFGREKVTGQKEVTKFVEGLLGASQDMASKLMLAKQKSLGSALSGGATAAGKMIEDLAGLDLIEEVRGLIADHLPSGNTASIEGMLSTLREQAAEPEQIDLAPLQAAVTAAESAYDAAMGAYTDVEVKLSNLDIAAANEILTDEKVLNAAIIGHQKAIDAAQVTLDKSPPAPVAAGAVEELQAKIAAQEDLASASKLHDQLKAAKVEMLWDQDFKSLELEVNETSTTVSELAAKIRLSRDTSAKITQARTSAVSTYQVKRAGLEGKLIKETTCALCQKDLKDVPEVARINSPLFQQLQELEAAHGKALASIDADVEAEAVALAEYEAEIATKTEYMKDLTTVVTRSRQLDLIYARAAKYIKLDESVVPALWTWIGPTGAPQNFSGELARLHEQQRICQEWDANFAVARQHLQLGQENLANEQARLAKLPLEDARDTLVQEAALKPQAAALLAAAQVAERAVRDASYHLDLAQQRAAAEVAAAEQAKANLKKTEATLAEMQANNALMKKLTAARPQITDKLWSTVLSSVSTYATDVRGEKSIITRADGKFRINGNPVSGLSGSAEDVLGLSIRFALTKTFLDVDFVILDEAAAACDDQRELAMLGMLATSGFAQTILVTHSQHADAFADNIITL